MKKLTINRPNFLGSEVGYVPKTIGFYVGDTSVSTAEETDSQGLKHTIVKKGSIYKNTAKGIYGLVVHDVDITGATADNQAEGALMIAGKFINDIRYLPAVVDSETLALFAKEGLFPTESEKWSYTFE